jgi:hypothetical protein
MVVLALWRMPGESSKKVRGELLSRDWGVRKGGIHDLCETL